MFTFNNSWKFLLVKADIKIIFLSLHFASKIICLLSTVNLEKIIVTLVSLPNNTALPPVSLISIWMDAAGRHWVGFRNAFFAGLPFLT